MASHFSATPSRILAEARKGSWRLARPQKHRLAAAVAAMGQAGLEPRQITSLSSVQEVVGTLVAQPAASVSDATLHAALERVHATANYGDADVPTAAGQLVRMGWHRLAGLTPDHLVTLLLVAAACQQCSPEQAAAWVERFTAARGVEDLAPEARVGLFEAVRLLQQGEAGRGMAALIPRGMLLRNLNKACRPYVVSKLSLRRLAQLYSCAEELGLQITATQHQGLSKVVRARLVTDFHQASVTKLLTAWISMQRRYQKWEASSGSGGGISDGGGRRPAVGEVGGARSPQHKLQESSSNLHHHLGVKGGVAEVGAAGGAVPDRMHLANPIPGYPGEGVMMMLLQQAHAHRAEMAVGGLAQLLFALGALRYAPSQPVMQDLVAALLPGLAGPRRGREVTAALDGLGKLGFDPGEQFAEACIAVVEEDGGRDKALVSTVARSLAILKRCTPKRWKRLVVLMESSHAKPRSKAPAQPPGRGPAKLPWFKWLPGWLTAYLLMQEQHGSRGEPLPFPGRVLRLREAVKMYKREPAGVDPSAQEIAELLQDLTGDAHPVQLNCRIRDVATGAPMLLDLGVPSLKLALHLERWYDRAVNTGAPVSKALIRGRLLRQWGWELVVVPAGLHEGSAGGTLGSGGQRHAVRAFLMEQTLLPQLLLGGSDGKGAPATGSQRPS